MKKATVFPVGLLTVLSASPTTHAQPVEWPPNQGGNGHFYEAVLAPNISWHDARAAALAAGGDLATLETWEENVFVFDLIDKPEFWDNCRGPWIGGYQDAGAQEPTGGWKWVNGCEISKPFWAPGEPNNYPDGSEDKIHFSWAPGLSCRAPYWNDIDASPGWTEIQGFVIEWTIPASLHKPATGDDIGKLECTVTPKPSGNGILIKSTVSGGVPNSSGFLFIGPNEGELCDGGRCLWISYPTAIVLPVTLNSTGSFELTLPWVPKCDEVPQQMYFQYLGYSFSPLLLGLTDSWRVGLSISE